MAPSAGRGNSFVFRREEERKAAEVASALDSEYRAGKSGAVRPTVSVLVARLQLIRNHAIGRQKKKYLEALAEKVLDNLRDGVAVAEAEEGMMGGGDDEETAALAAAMALVDSEKEDELPDKEDNDVAEAMDVSRNHVRRRKDARNGDETRNGRPLWKRKRRRYRSSSSRSSSGGERRTRGDDSDNNGGSGSARDKGIAKPTEIAANAPTFEDVAGMDNVLRDLIRLVWMPLRRGFDFQATGSRPNEAVLLYGPSGCGKTLLANVIAAEARVPFFSVSAPSLVGGISGESETNIRNVFDEALRQAPSLVFIDSIEAVASKQDFSGKGPMEMRMALTLASCVDRLQREGRGEGKYVVVLAATNKADSLDPLVRRRFGVEIAVRMPSQDARERILQTMTRGMQFADNVDLKEIARMTPGFVGGDLQNVVKTAQLRFMDTKLEAVLSRLREASSGSGGGDDDDSEGAAAAAGPSVQSDIKLLNAHEDERVARLAAAAAAATAEHRPDERGTATPVLSGITAQNFRDAALSVLPAAKREGFSTIPNTTWKQVGAMEVLRKKLEMSIIGPIRYPDKYAAVGQKPMGGILLWGPPGCGKTLVAKAVANESKANFISIRGPELLNKWVGESERALRELFERARAMAPCIIFFDEMDALAAKRDDARSDGSARIVNTLLTELDGVVDRTGLFVIGATNRPDIIDPAIKRPGRLGESIFVGPPTADDRVAILQTLFRNAVPADGTHPANMDMLADVALDARCTGFSGADLDHLLRAAGKHSLERTGLHSAETPRILLEDWEAALNETQPSTSVAELKRYERLQ